MTMAIVTVLVLGIINLLAFASHDDRLKTLERKALKKIGGTYE